MVNLILNKIIFFTYKIKHKCKNELLVQLGAFNQPMKDWYNTDITPHIFITRIPFLPKILFKFNKLTKNRYIEHKNGIFKQVYYLDIRKKFPFKNNSVKAYFSSHVFEHLYFYEFEFVLKEIYRTLKNDGYLRIVLPDLDYVIKLYDSKDPTKFLEYMYENHKKTLSKNAHKWMYSAEYCKSILEKNNFRNVKICKYQQTSFEPFKLLDNRKDESIYIEAIK